MNGLLILLAEHRGIIKWQLKHGESSFLHKENDYSQILPHVHVYCPV